MRDVASSEPLTFMRRPMQASSAEQPRCALISPKRKRTGEQSGRFTIHDAPKP